MTSALDRRLSPHFTLRELTRSATADRLGLANLPDAAGIALLTDICNLILEPVRCFWGPVRITSGYRSPALNARIGGSKTSEHVLCRAVDFKVLGKSNYEVAYWIAHGGLPKGFRQLILEAYTRGDPNSGWIHCSLPKGESERKVMTMVRRNGETVYLPGLVQ